MAGEALSRAGEFISSFKLTPGSHGKFDVIVDGKVVAEHKHLPDAHLFPDLQDLLKAINERTGRTPSGRNHP
jgi:predicted Rdx family selenoprotein